MKIKTEPRDIYKEYMDGVSYNTSIDLYDNVEKNNNMYHDKQWEGVNAPDLDKPVFNFIKPVVNFYISQIVSDDISADFEVMGNALPNGAEISKILSKEIDIIMENTNAKSKHRRLLKNMAIDGDMCLYSYYDPEIEKTSPIIKEIEQINPLQEEPILPQNEPDFSTFGMEQLFSPAQTQPQDVMPLEEYGRIKTEIINNTDIYFGNPINNEVEEQPYIILRQRKLTQNVREEAKKNHLPTEDIMPDQEDNYDFLNDVSTEKYYTTVLIKFWKENNSVWYIKVTKNAIVQEKTNLEYSRYPICFCNWESVKNSYHGVSPITGKRSNQIFVNKLYAMAMEYTKKMAFPKLLYDRTKISKWSNKIGEAIAVTGDPREALFANFQGANMSGQVMELVSSTIQQTKEMMGAYDAALGNVKPENTSALIAVQKSATMPLELQRQDFYDFIESMVRIWIDIMAHDYGVRMMDQADDMGNEIRVPFDFNDLQSLKYKLNVEIGPSAYWSELTQIQTLDSLLRNQIIPDAVTYLENVPDGYIKGKSAIIAKIKELQQQQAAAQQAAAQQAQMQAAPQNMGGVISDGFMPQM